MTLEKSERHSWWRNRTVPASLIGAIVVQAGAFVWSYAQLISRVDFVEKWINDNKAVMSRLDRLEVQNEFIRSSLTRIETKITER